MTILIIATVVIFIAGMLFDFIYGLMPIWEGCQPQETPQVRVEDVFSLLDDPAYSYEYVTK